MKLYIGGAYQGQDELAVRENHGAEIIPDFHEKVRDAILKGESCFRTSKELGLHVLEVLQGMLESGADRSLHTMTTSCSIPPAFYT